MSFLRSAGLEGACRELFEMLHPCIFIDATAGNGDSIKAAREMGIEAHGLDRNYVPGDLKKDSLDWTKTNDTQSALLADGKTRVEITPEVLKSLIKRRDTLINYYGVAASPAQAPSRS